MNIDDIRREEEELMRRERQKVEEKMKDIIDLDGANDIIDELVEKLVNGDLNDEDLQEQIDIVVGNMKYGDKRLRKKLRAERIVLGIVDIINRIVEEE